MNEVVNGLAGTNAKVAVLPNGTGQDFGRTHAIPTASTTRCGSRSGARRETVDVGRVDARRRDALLRERRLRGNERFRRAPGELDVEGLGGRTTFFYALTREFLAWQNTEVTVRLDDGDERRARCTT